MLLREPLKPATPPDPHESTAPVGSVMEITVLLKDAAMCTWPTGTFFFSRRRVFVGFFSISAIATPLPYFFSIFLPATVLRAPRR